MRTLKELKAELKGSSILRLILLELQKGKKTWKQLETSSGVKSSQTLSFYLDRAKNEGLVEHKKRNAPYKITPRGINLLKMTEPKIVDDFLIEYVKSGDFSGSIIFRVPKRFAQVFNSLYQPGPLEGLRRAFLVAFEFWVNRYGCGAYSESTGQRAGGPIAFGKDFNKDEIWDLTMYEAPASGYPNIKKALKKRFFTLNGKKRGLHSDNLWIWALNSLEEHLSKADL